MPPSVPPSDSPLLNQRHLKRYLRWKIPITVLSIGVLGVLTMIEPSTTLNIVLGLALVYTGILLWARWKLYQYGAENVSIILGLSTCVIAVVIGALLPFMAPVLIFFPIEGIAISLLYTTTRNARYLVSTVWLSMMLVVTLFVWHTPFAAPPLLMNGFLILMTAATTSLTIWLLWLYRCNLLQLLAEVRSAQMDVQEREHQFLHTVKNTEEALQRRDAILAAVSFAAQEFLKTPDYQHAIQSVLQRIGLAAGVSRVYVFQNHQYDNGALVMRQRYEWVAAGISPQLNNTQLQELDYHAEGFERWVRTLRQNKLICGAIRTFPPSEQRVLLPQDILSIVIVPIFVDNAWWGFIGFDQCHTEHAWSLAEKEALRAAAGILGAAIQHDQAHAALRAAEEKYRSIVEQAVEGIFQSTPEGRYLSANPALARIYGYSSPEELIQSIKNIGDQMYVDPDIRRQFIERLLQEGAVSGFEAQVYRKDGQVIWISQSARVVRNATDIPCYYEGTVEDITERKRAEEQRLELERRLQEVQKFESLGVLAGGIAHDFNNLLGAILGNATLALEELPPESAARPLLGHIEIATRRAADLTQHMLAYVGKGRITRQDLDLNEALLEIIDLLKPSLPRHTTLHYDLEPALPPFEGDATQIRQVILNLLINAAEALQDKPGDIRIATRIRYADRDYLATTYLTPELPAGTYIMLEIADTGCGMDTETQARMFDPFFTTKFTGRGLGLAAVLGIVRNHRGALTCTSSPGQGTTFQILFPYSDRPAAALLSTASAPHQNGAQAWCGQGTILIIDDEAGVRMITERMLERMGFTTLTAADGQTGIDCFRQHADTITGVLLDLTMPGLSGEQTLHELYRLRANVRVVVMSGYAEEEVLKRFAGWQLAGVLHKPFTLDELRTKMYQSFADVLSLLPTMPEQQLS